MATFISHNRIPADTPQNMTRISYLLNSPVAAQVETMIKTYFLQHPAGVEVTLEVFKGIGSLKSLAKRLQRSEFSLKQDIGLLVSIKGEQLFGKPQFQTLRNAATGKNSIRRVPVKVRPSVDVDNYTPHRLAQNSHIEDLFGCLESVADGVKVQDDFRRYDLP